MAEESTQSSGLFSVFILSIYTLVLLPYSIYYLCGTEDDTAQPIAKSKKQKESKLSAAAKRLGTKSNLTLIGLWVVWLGILWYTQMNMKDLKPFDPFDILGVEHSASDREIRKAYYKLSKEYHPDKNPDPKAHKYFAEYVTKAYQALTDEVSRKNYEKYGHPDGPQGMNLGVALPDWILRKDKKTAPLMLLGLVGFGILLPLSLISWYMLTSNKYVGANRIYQETLAFYFYDKKLGIKESQALVRIPETLMIAREFIDLYTPADQQQPMDELRKLVTPYYQDVMAKDKKGFWQRKASVVKAHMLLLAHLERLNDDVPNPLQQDLKYVLTKSPLLLEEMLKIALVPRTQSGTGWMTPAMACVEMMQCISQGLSINARKGSTKGGDVAAPLLQLPHMDQDALKKLRKQKVNALKDLQDLSEAEQAKVLKQAGLTESEVEEAVTFLTAFPHLALAARCEVDGEEDIREQDPVKCRVRVLLRRPSHKQDGFKLSGKSVRAYTPHYPMPRDESWYFFLTDPGNNAVIAWDKVTLMEAEKEGFAHPEAFEGETSTTTGSRAGGKPSSRRDRCSSRGSRWNQ